MVPLRAVIVAGVLATAPQICRAADPVPRGTTPTERDIIVTGTISNVPDGGSQPPRYTIGADEIAAQATANVTDLLRAIPGVQIVQQGGGGGLNYVSLRGGEPNYTLVFIDGVKANDPTNSRGGGFDFVALDPLLVDRIDAFYGAYSSVYGSDALGGVISVSTKGPSSRLAAEAALVGGTDDARAASLYLAGPLIRGVEGSVAGVARNGGDAVPGDRLHRRQVSVKLRSADNSDARPTWWANLFVSAGDRAHYPEASGGDQLAVVRDVETGTFRQLSASAGIGLPLTDIWRVDAQIAWLDHRDVIDSPAIAPGVLSGVPAMTSDNRYRRAGATLVTTIKPSDALTLALGGEFAREQGRIDSVIDFGFPLDASFRLTRYTYAGFGEAILRLTPRLDVTASLRHDDVEKVHRTTSRILGRYVFEGGTTVSLGYATSFKAPSLFALGQPLTGNPDLKPENARNVELRIVHPFLQDRVTATFSAYHTQYTNRIDFDAATFRHVNRDPATVWGGEVAIAAKLSQKLSLDGSVSHVDTRSIEDFKLRPRWSGSAGLKWTDRDLSVSVRGALVGQYYDVSVPTGLRLLDGYARVDAAVQWKANSHLRLGINADNLLNRGYQETIGFSNPGRQIRVSLNANY